MAEAMESVSCSEPKRSYSWWWDSHITPKNSKWLQENLADMDSKIESMIELIEEDADSFARRAEMYYKKRPELMKLVEEFYRAYRALAERYDHVTGALRQAHRTIAVAFPNQIQFILPDEPPSALHDTAEEVKDNFTSPSYSNGSPEPAGKKRIPFMSKEEWKQLNCLLAEDEAQKKFTECFLMEGLNLNKNLMNPVISEPEISQNREEVCHLNDEICLNVPTFDLTEERCLDLEKENRSLQSELNDFNAIVSRQMEEVLDLSKKNQNLHNNVESESLRAELAEAESCRLRDVISNLRPETERLSDLKTEISYTGNQFRSLSNEMSIGSSILNMAEEQFIILQEENNSLQHTVDEFKTIVEGQGEDVKEEESNKFTPSVEDERNRQMIAKVVNNQSLKKFHSQYEEQIMPLGLGILSGTEMRRMELSRAELGELKIFNDEDNYLNEKSFCYISKVDGFQDDINSPRRSKLEIADETEVQEDVSHFSKHKSTPKERYHELKKRIEEVNFNLVSLRALIMELHDWKHKPTCFHLEDLKLMNKTSDMNCISEKSELHVNAELSLLRENIKGLEYWCESVQRDSPNYESQNTALVSHVEAADQNIKKFWEKSRFFENSLSDIFVEFEGLRAKMKALEESCQSHFHQNCDLVTENNSLIAQLENIEQNMQSLEDRFSNFEGKYVNMQKENDLLILEKEGQENQVLLFRNRTSDLNNQIQILREENKHLNGELEDEQHKTVKSGIDFCIMQNFLYDMNEKNLILSYECQMHMKKLRSAEKLASKFKQDQLMQEKILALLLEHDKKLSEWMHLMLMEFESKEDCVTSKGGNKDMMHPNSHKMVELQVSVSDSNVEFHHLQIEKSSFTVLLEQLGLSLVELRAQENVLQQESEKMNEEISFLHGKNYELTGVSEKLGKDFTASYRQQEEVKIEMEEKHNKLSKLSAGRCISHGEIPTLIAETRSLSNKLYESKEQKNVALKGEGQEMVHDHLFRVFSSDAEKLSTIDQLASGVRNLNGITNDLDYETAVRNGNMRALQHGNMHSETKDVKPTELEMIIQVLLKENVRKDDEIDFLRQSNSNFVTESSIWHKKAKALRRREEILMLELQRAKDGSKLFEDELTAWLFDFHVASISGLMYEQKLVEMVFKLKNLEAFDSIQSQMPIEEGSLRNVQSRILMEKLHALENENKELKELTGYLPLVVSLENDITSLEELTLSPANHHVLSSKKNQGNNVLAPHQTMKFSQVRGEDHIPMFSSGILVLKKLHATVKLLQKEVINTEMLLAQEETAVDSNSSCKTRETKARRSKGSTSQLETEKKKDIVFDSRKSNASGKDVRLNRKLPNAKHEHIMKDIELDHVSSFRSDFRADGDEQAPKMLEADVNYFKEDEEIEIMEGERSANPSSEFVLEKELSIDTIELPENVSKTHEEWYTRIGEILSSDALRLTALQKNVEEMKNINGSALSAVNEQLKASEAVVMQLTDINFKLARIAHNFASSSDDHDDSGRWKLSDRVQRASEKIGEVELELENTLNSSLKIQKEEEESKETKSLQRKSRISFMGFLYGRRTDSRQKKRRFCGACMGLSNKDD